MLDICIIGAGASGLAAAIAAGQENKGKSILVLEKKELPGKKLSATGNGKCNLTNIHCQNVTETLLFFDALGIYTRTDEEGRVYPYCSQAKDVVHALVQGAEAVGAEIRTNCTVEKINKKGNVFEIHTNDGMVHSMNLLIATGGKAAPQFGTTGDGYTFAKAFGHTVNRLAPVLTGIETKENLTPVKGVRVKADVKLLKDGEILRREFGEVQFNADGISGICVMNLSRYIKLEKGESFADGIQRYGVQLDLVPEMDSVQLESFLKRRFDRIPENLLLSILPQPLRQWIMESFKTMQKQDLRNLSKQLKSLPLSVKGTKGWKQAQCTSGGIAMDEIHGDTMESCKIDGLYFSGEVIDYDGPCGGYNLQYAWETGIKAGKAMANVL